MKATVMAIGVALGITLLAGCGTQDPFGRDTGESTPAEDDAAISNYVTTTTIMVTVPGNNNQVSIGNGNRPSLDTTTTTDNHANTDTNAVVTL